MAHRLRVIQDTFTAAVEEVPSVLDLMEVTPAEEELPSGIEASLKATSAADLQATVFLALLNEGYEIYREMYWQFSLDPLDALAILFLQEELKALMKALPAPMRPDLNFCECGKIKKGSAVCRPVDITK